MSFRIRKDARREFFSELRKEFDIDFHVYYMCLMAGLAARRKTNAPSADTVDLVDNFPGDYKKTGRLIVALLLRTELAVQGVTLEERAKVHERVRELVNSRAASGLSEKGFAEANKYAFAGYDVLTEQIDDKPRSLEIFEFAFKKCINELLAAGGVGAVMPV